MNGKRAKRIYAMAKESFLFAVTNTLPEEEAAKLLALPWEEQKELLEYGDNTVKRKYRKLKKLYVKGGSNGQFQQGEGSFS